MNFPLLNEWGIYRADTQALSGKGLGLFTEHGLDLPLTIWTKEGSTLSGPYWEDVDFFDLPQGLRRGTMVADFEMAKNDYHVRYWGDDLVTAFGVELTYKWLGEADHRGVMDSFIRTAHEIVDTGEPQFLIHQITSKNGVRRHFPVLRMPIFNREDRVDKIMTIENIQMCHARL